MIDLVVFGSRGRMGARICELARGDKRFNVAAEWDVHDTPRRLENVDVVIDFSSDQGAQRAIDCARTHAASLLVGTTALSTQTLSALEVASSEIAVIVASNTSLGIAVVTALAVQTARWIGSEATVSIVETHHAQKRDAPSGTAVSLARALADRGGVAVPSDSIHALRGGDVVGDHTVEFFLPGERIQLTHRATSRDLFVRGALRAATWLAGRAAGRYTIEQTLVPAPATTT